MEIKIPASYARVLDARAKRLNTSTADITRSTGWESVVDNELTEARARHQDKFLGGEELLLTIEADAESEVSKRKAV